jgi:carboxymethylenebutenolidase
MTKLARRSLIVGLAGLPLALVLADPKLAAAAAATLENVSLKLADGTSVGAALAKPAKVPAPAVLLVHEWWGLNDQIKSVAAELANQGYVALAIDLYGGHVATDPDTAGTLMKSVDPARATETLVGWIDWLRRDADVNGRIATIGWCFGGGWSLRASLARPVEATVIYYGDVTPPADKLAALKGPVLGHFAEQDKWINHEMVAGFEGNMKAAGKSLTDYWYDANHAFANPTGASYHKADARLAWSRTLAFLKKNLA